MNFTNINKVNYPEIARIYQEGIQTSLATFETEVPNWENWNEKYLPFARLVLLKGNKIVGWAALSKVSNRHVYRGVAEVSIYVAREYYNQGIGTILLNKLIKESEVNEIWTLQSGIFKDNVTSINLHKNCGFRTIGYREKIGQLNGIWHDNVIMERRSNKVGL